MRPDDPRHGSPAGCQAHWKDRERPCTPCLAARRRASKQTQLDVLDGQRTSYTWDAFYGLLEPWLAMGLTVSSVAIASGIKATGSARWTRVQSPVLRSTWNAVAAVTEDSFPDRWTLWSDLTRTRVQSLMAAGHQLVDMPVDPRGRWRDSARISVGHARAMRDYYATHQHVPGPSAHTRNRSRRAGFVPPAAWDDPGTLAWPLGWTSPIPGAADVDVVVVDRILAGERIPCTPAEKDEVIRRAPGAGRSLYSLERQMGWNSTRERKRVAA